MTRRCNNRKLDPKKMVVVVLNHLDIVDIKLPSYPIHLNCFWIKYKCTGTLPAKEIILKAIYEKINEKIEETTEFIGWANCTANHK